MRQSGTVYPHKVQIFVILANVEPILHQVPDTRGGQGRQYSLAALLGLILLSMISGRKGMKAAFRLGRSLTPPQLKALGFRPGCTSPCHATLTQLLRILDPDAMALVFSRVIAKPDDKAKADCNHIAIDGKTLRGSKDNEGKAEHVLSAFCAYLEQSVGHTSSRGKGMQIPDALKLLEEIDLTDKIITGDAIFCHRERSPRKLLRTAGIISCR